MSYQQSFLVIWLNVDTFCSLGCLAGRSTNFCNRTQQKMHKLKLIASECSVLCGYFRLDWGRGGIISAWRQYVLQLSVPHTGSARRLPRSHPGSLQVLPAQDWQDIVRMRVRARQIAYMMICPYMACRTRVRLYMTSSCIHENIARARLDFV